MCIDSKFINKITIRYRFHFPRMDNIIYSLSVYHHIRIREEDEWEDILKTNEGLYEWLIIPFGLTNGSSTFMRLMKEVSRSS